CGIHQQPADTLPSARSVDDETSNDDEGLGLQVLSHFAVYPSDRPAIEFSDEDLLVRACEHSRQTRREQLRIHGVAELARQLRNRWCVRRARRPQRHLRHIARSHFLKLTREVQRFCESWASAGGAPRKYSHEPGRSSTEAIATRIAVCVTSSGIE